MDVVAYLISYLLLNVVSHPIKVFLVFTAATATVSFFFIYLGEKIYSKFKKKNNLNLFIVTAVTVLVYFAVAALYDLATESKPSFSLIFWLFETIFVFIIIKIVEWIHKKWLKGYNLPHPLEVIFWALIGSSIAWLLIIPMLYSSLG